ncbi:MAG: YSC84-related protein [Bacillota bacterium]|nr:YSC84-related protein [Bacillota bacterium]
MRARSLSRTIVWAVCLSLVGSFLVFPTVSQAKTAREIDVSVNAAMGRFMQQVKGSKEFLQASKGILVFAGVWKAGAGIGGQYGEGALRIRGQTVAYYNITSASIGFQLGIQKKDIILVFLQDSALRKFRASEGWQVGVDGAVVLVDQGAAASINTRKFDEPIVGFVVGEKGLMYNLTLEGSKISKMRK